ncbi:hydantoinase B/oxoprolinase family protein [Pseudooceanicola sp. GBMRC 2024]|uniref:Hydantoinase B/oxoprolinase family protein n=1 Tax=Pseudooceanicola albus TaxID=2692189 RepID=A0A6L7G0Z3_9RHOB|nr:hydantoinase B/oxoprolinase family protein [Pseudooceanicola albus]MXN17731.1 hydantoinase B/oxoprolinase family protein [Pseudooceanicola albus]
MPEQSSLPEFDPVLLAVMANRLDAIVREMTSTVLLTASSSVIGMARDFSCTILSAEDEILSAADGVPVHVFGGNLQSARLKQVHPDMKEGDAFLNNDPYSGNSHAADHTFLVPVFHEGRHVFTAAVKCHQADCGNSLPTTYHASARDIYAEGALIFPMVQIQKGYKTNDDIVRMCLSRIRTPEQWHGDFISAISAARAGERALKQLIAKFGLDTVMAFKDAWMDYSERRADAALKALPQRTITRTGQLDAMGDFQNEQLDIKVAIKVDPDAGAITIDLRDNPDCLDNGLNLTEATASAAAICGVVNCLEDDLPLNSGTFRRIRVLLREGSCAGIPVFPHSCSVATTVITDIIINLVQEGLSELGEDFGLAEGNISHPISESVIAGHDARRNGADYVNQVCLIGGGGPASGVEDGLHNYICPAGAGICYRDSVEVAEQRFPMMIHQIALVTASGGAGRRRGGPATRVEFGPRNGTMSVMSVSSGMITAPRGARGGHGTQVATNILLRDGVEVETHGGYVEVRLRPGETVLGTDSGGGGFGDPMTREPERVLYDVLERYETAARARDIYGVALLLDEDGTPLGIDETATRALRNRAAALETA